MIYTIFWWAPFLQHVAHVKELDSILNISQYQDSEIILCFIQQ